MSRFPLLEVLRDSRERAEEEAVAPVRIELACSRAQLHRTQDAMRALERIATSSYGKIVLERIASDVARELRVAIVKATASIRPRSRKRVATLRIPLDVLRFSQAGTLEREILNHWAEKAPRALSVHARIDGTSPLETSTVLSVTIPAITRGSIVQDLP